MMRIFCFWWNPIDCKISVNIVKWQKWWLRSIRVKIGLHKCQSEVGTQCQIFLVKWADSVRLFWWSGTRWMSDSITKYKWFINFASFWLTFQYRSKFQKASNFSHFLRMKNKSDKNFRFFFFDVLNFISFF